MNTIMNAALYNRFTAPIIAYANPVDKAIGKANSNVVNLGYLIIAVMFLRFLLKGGDKFKMWGGMVAVGAGFFFITGGGAARFAPIAEAVSNYFK